MIKKIITISALSVLALFALGCGNTIGGVKDDIKQLTTEAQPEFPPVLNLAEVFPGETAQEALCRSETDVILGQRITERDEFVFNAGFTPTQAIYLQRTIDLSIPPVGFDTLPMECYETVFELDSRNIPYIWKFEPGPDLSDRDYPRTIFVEGTTVEGRTK